MAAVGGDRLVQTSLVNEAGFGRSRKYEIQARMDDEWITVTAGTVMKPGKEIVFPAPVRAEAFRLNILESADVPMRNHSVSRWNPFLKTFGFQWKSE